MYRYLHILGATVLVSSDYTSDREPSSFIDNYDNNNNIMTICRIKVSWTVSTSVYSILLLYLLRMRVQIVLLV